MVASLEVKPDIVAGASAPHKRARGGRVTVITTHPRNGSGEAAPGPVQALNEPNEEEEIPHALIAAVAHELWGMHGGNDVLNWLEAERLLRRLLAARRGTPAWDVTGATAGGVEIGECPAVAQVIAAQSERVLNGHAKAASLEEEEAT